MKVAINLMVNQLLGASSEREEDEMARWFSDFVDGCLSLPINFPGFAYHTAMKVKKNINKHQSRNHIHSHYIELTSVLTHVFLVIFVAATQFD